MKKLEEFTLLGANTARTKAYLQVLAKNGYIPGHVILMAEDPETLLAEGNHNLEPDHAGLLTAAYFHLEEPVVCTLRKWDIPFEIVSAGSVNDPRVLEVVRNTASRFIIYSGFGGQILRKPILSLGKKFLHIHPGIVPEFRGSTTVYYSLLKEGCVGASAIFLEEKIDTGPIIKTKRYPVPKPFPDMDYIFDPFIRASLLTEVIAEYVEKGEFETRVQSGESGETYYIIHPVLKHIAILSLE